MSKREKLKKKKKKTPKNEKTKLTLGTRQNSVLFLQAQSLGSTSRHASCWLIVQRGSEGQAEQPLHLGPRQIDRLTGKLRGLASGEMPQLQVSF